MGSVMLVPCRSYSARAFDGCPACVGAALDAVGQAGLYILGRSAPDLMSGPDGPLELSYRLKVRLLDELGEELASDELEAEQTIEAVPPVDDFADPVRDREDEAEAGDEPYMRLEDFQTVLDRLQLAPTGWGRVSGFIGGHLYGFERLIGQFEIEVCPDR